jgi:hypothetical protein
MGRLIRIRRIGCHPTLVTFPFAVANSRKRSKRQASITAVRFQQDDNDATAVNHRRVGNVQANSAALFLNTENRKLKTIPQSSFCPSTVHSSRFFMKDCEYPGS